MFGSCFSCSCVCIKISLKKKKIEIEEVFAQKKKEIEEVMYSTEPRWMDLTTDDVEDASGPRRYVDK